MAGDWIKMTHALPEKPEVLAIAGKTGITRFEVVGRLFILWRWFDINTTDGNAVGVTSVTLEECLFGYHTNARFVDSVLAVRWLLETQDGISVVKFDEHISESAKTRAQTAKRVAKSKANAKGNAEGNAVSVTNSVTKTVPREEKRREEYSVPTGTDGGAVKPPSDLTKAELWSAGKSLLRTAGMPEAQCGSFVGKLCKDYGDQIVIDAVRETVVKQAGDPASFMKSECQRLAGERTTKPAGKHAGFEKLNYREGVTADGSLA
jgi:chorismate mutase